ncbi:polysaccharide pyruvyl transferase family protein [Bacillus sp. FJAT-29790]|uniref:polysaccharide pyruvyl transferase family protein n=1 Tax=Bacillus sp. FJAT-29790 TaxID=1895002 RepID=UPI001C24F33A|nr:polysaccharide pyruvyl transferase family protein [Bacillus sp. FJAT-29790]MBU8881154.1 polysaccharide pyruvyl transferase family protein [Bacillus sp. FJAT-29790]
MKVGIVGNYGHDNNGDEAILQGILTQLLVDLNIDRENITIFSNNPENTKARYGLKAVKLLHKRGSLLKSVAATINKNNRIIKELDVLIIGGGGLLMDMYKRDAPLYFSHALMGRFGGCKVVIYGVGAGPITTKSGSFLIKRMIGAAHSISVRDSESKELLEKIGVEKPIQIIADPAFKLGERLKKEMSLSVKKIGVTAVPYFSKEYWPESNEEKYEAFVFGMANNLDEIIKEHDAEITFFSTKYPQDVKVTEDIVNVMKEKGAVTILKDNLNPDQLVSICGKQDIIIGTRLHSLILSVAAETPIVGVGYHRKVRNFMRRISKEKYYIDIEQMNKPGILNELIHEYKRNWQMEQKSFSTISSQQVMEAKKGLEQIGQVLR